MSDRARIGERLGEVARRRRIRRRARRVFPDPGQDVGPTFLLGLPIPLLVIAFACSALIGLLLAYALTLTTQAAADRTGVDAIAAGKNPDAATVVTDSTLGTEVQSMMDSNSLRTNADFDVPQCLQEQGITDQVLAMEEVSYGSDLTDSWLIVHGQTDAASLRADGGTVNVTVVLPSCGSSTDQDASSMALWSGSVMLGAADD